MSALSAAAHAFFEHQKYDKTRITDALQKKMESKIQQTPSIREKFSLVLLVFRIGNQKSILERHLFSDCFSMRQIE